MHIVHTLTWCNSVCPSSSKVTVVVGVAMCLPVLGVNDSTLPAGAGGAGMAADEPEDQTDTRPSARSGFLPSLL